MRSSCGSTITRRFQRVLGRGPGRDKRTQTRDLGLQPVRVALAREIAQRGLVDLRRRRNVGRRVSAAALGAGAGDADVGAGAIAGAGLATVAGALAAGTGAAGVGAGVFAGAGLATVAGALAA